MNPLVQALTGRSPSAPFFRDMVMPSVRVSYALRRLPESSFSTVLPIPGHPEPGDVALAYVERLGKNTSLELTSGRRCALHEGDLLGVVFGNRYATQQFEGYADVDGDRCDLLSIGGLCGLMRAKHCSVSEPTKLRLVGAIGDAHGTPLNLSQATLAPLPLAAVPRVIVVCGTSMDAGKTHAAMSLIVGLKRDGHRVAAMKLTGTACGKDTWAMNDAGAFPVYDFIDGGYPSTYQCSLEQLLSLYQLLTTHAGAQGADCVVVEIADGLLQQETAALLNCPAFTTTVTAWIFATGDPIAALGGVRLLREWDIEPTAVSGLISLSPLAMQEAESVTRLPYYTAKELQQGIVNDRVFDKSSEHDAASSDAELPAFNAEPLESAGAVSCRA